MKKIALTSLLCFSVACLISQSISFDTADPQPSLTDVYAGSFTSGDVDGDGDSDLMLSGITPAKRTALYLNDGAGDFVEVSEVAFPTLSSGQVHFDDLDGDGDLDLFFTGNGSNQDFIFLNDFTHIYLNDGNGSFSQLNNPALPDSNNGRVVFGDLDGDNDIDLIMNLSEVYLNNGNAVFSFLGNTSSDSFQYGIAELIDSENDGDLDVIISGTQDDNSESFDLYINDGSANFSQSVSSSFIQFSADDVDAGDVDGDGDSDILVSGLDGSTVLTEIYANDGSGVYSELNNPVLQQTFFGTNSIADLDNDGDQDLVIIGSQNGGLPNIYGIIYENINNIVFAPVDTIAGEYIASSIVDDFNGNGLPDLVVQGFIDKTNVYWNSSDVPTGNNVSGCTNASACNYNELATIPDDSCEYSCYGCTDSEALNFDSAHTIDDGSCVYCEPSTCEGDFNGDGFVTVADLTSFLGIFGEACE